MTHTHSYWKRLRIVARFSYVKSQRTIHIAIRSRKFRKAFSPLALDFPFFFAISVTLFVFSISIMHLFIVNILLVLVTFR